MLHLLNIDVSPRKNKKLRAYFENNGRLLYTDFGKKDSQTYIDHKIEKLRENYLKRHGALNEDWEDPTSAGALSAYLLWSYANSYSTTLADNIKIYKKKFKI